MKKTKTTASAAPRSTTVKTVTPAIKPQVAVKRSKPAGPQPTEISANIDVGFGNTLYIRGEGPGLSWDRGQPMNCVKDDIWSFAIEAAARPIIFKLLTNDEMWCSGDDYVVEPGKKIALVPTF